MSLDSSDTVPQAAVGTPLTDGHDCMSGKKEHPETSWVFLFTHRMKLDRVNQKLGEKFETFVHRSIVYQRNAKGNAVKHELPTISGLIFIHGAADEVRRFLNETFSDIYLVKNYSTGKTAEIPDKEMQSFIKLSKWGASEVRFMLNPLDYYAEGHQRIRITSGDLKGCEGYIVRIHRDRRLVTQIGNMTVAISGVTKESFENAEDFVKSRQTEVDIQDMGLNPIEREIARRFFTPLNDLEAMAIAKNLVSLLNEFNKGMQSQNVVTTVNEIIFTLSQIAYRFDSKYFKNQSVGINDISLTLVNMLKDAIESPVIADDIKEQIAVNLEALMLRYPTLSIDATVNSTIR